MDNFFYHTFMYFRRKQFHLNARRKAYRSLAEVESKSGKLPETEKKRATEYAIDVLGSKKYAPWLLVFAAMHGGFREGLIPPDYYRAEVLPRINGSYGALSGFKNFTNRILQDESIPDLAYVIDGLFYTRDYRPLPADRLEEWLFRDTELVFYKRNHSKEGLGLILLHPGSFDINELKGLQDGAFQKGVKQHPFFAEIVPDSTSTVRVTSVRNLAGEIEIREVRLRFGRKDERHLKSATSICIPVDQQTGDIGPLAYMPDFSTVDKHPDTGFVFSGKRVPGVQETVDHCRSLHESIPHLGIIGWDTCFDQENKVKIFEWNCRLPGIKTTEITAGPCFTGLGWEHLWKRGDRITNW